MTSTTYPKIPEIPYRNHAYRGVWLRGWYGRLNRGPRLTCPYQDIPAHSGRVTFSRGFIRAWGLGFEAAATAIRRQNKRRRHRS